MTTYTRPRNARLRVQVFAHYGESCACCGTTEHLSIDHVNGDGKEHRAAIGIGRGTQAMYHWLIANSFPAGFQTLCVPCNKSKGNREHCILDHSSGTANGMTSAERSRRWREEHGYVQPAWGTCAACGYRHRVRKDGTMQAHGGGPRRGPRNGRRSTGPACAGAGKPPFADLLREGGEGGGT